MFAYPFGDAPGYVLLSVFVGLALLAGSVAAFGKGIAFLFSQGLVLAYAFSAINRVAAGHMSGFMPEISDLTDLIEPVRCGFAATIVSSGPLLLVLLLVSLGTLPAIGGAALAPEPQAEMSPPPTLPPEVQTLVDEGEQEGAEDAATEDAQLPVDTLAEQPLLPAWVTAVALLLALTWKVVYSPVALIAAAISRSFWSTLNPIVGLGAIRHMGAVYWEAMLVYAVLALAELVGGWVTGLVPLAGHILNGFVLSYVYLAAGCLLGLAVFKKAHELGLD